MSLETIDLLVVAGYFILIAAIGVYVSRGQNTTVKFFVSGHSIPGWVVAFTLMGTIIGTGTFVGHPVLFITGWITSRLFGGYRPDHVEDLTFWSHKLRADAAAARNPSS